MIQQDKTTRKCAIYVRVSTGEQNLENQIKQLETFAKLHDYEIYKIYKDIITGGASNRPSFQQMLNDARLRKFNAVLVWSLDRFSREGIKNTLNYIKQLKHNNVSLKSIQESWLDTSDTGMGELLIAIFSWIAEQERKRISERTKVGLMNAKNVGKRGKDKKKRETLGYMIRWNKQRVSNSDGLEKP